MRNSLWVQCLFATVLTVAFSLSLTLARVDASPATKSLQEFYLDATLGNAKASAQVLETIENLLIQYPNDPLLTAYYGSTLSMKARDAWLPWNRQKFVAAGVSSLNKSLALLTEEAFETPYYGLNEGIYIQSLAAISFMHMPTHLNQRQRGLEILSAMMNSDSFHYYPFGPRAWIHIGAVKGALEMGEIQFANRWANEMKMLAPTHPLTREALTLVKEAKI